MKIAIIGNPNCGKTSLFNKLTGSNQKVGNWPGVTIEKKIGKLFKSDIDVVDLPGVYSLFPYSEEEKVSRNFLLNEKPEIVLNVIDSTVLERSLYLTSQLLDMGVKVVLALNMNDLLEKKGIKLDEKKLSEELGVPAIKVSAKTGCGIKELAKILQNSKAYCELKKLEIYSKVIENELFQTKKMLNLDNNFLAIESLIDSENKENLRAKQILEKLYKSDVMQIVASQKYDFIERVRDKCLIAQNKKETISEKLDTVFLNKWLAIPIFAVIMSFVYVLSVGVVGDFTTGFVNEYFAKVSVFLTKFLKRAGASNWAISLLVDGVIAGASSVLSFVPELIVIFLCISILENTGYMSRIAFVFDRLFRRFGLSGKSLVPFIVGTGCSVPAISLTKTIENSSEREMTAILTPFVPCSAKLPIIALFVGFFFPNCSGLVTASFYFLAIFVILICSMVLKKFIFKSDVETFVLELPEYKLPSLKYVSRDVFDKTKEFVVRAGTIIVLCSVVVWFLSTFSWNLSFANSIENSILAGIGNLISWFFYPIVGEWNWAISVSAIQGIIAKEQVVSSLSVIAGLSENLVGSSIFLGEIFSGFTKASAYAFVVFNLFSAPCIASIAAMKNELKSTKKTLLAILFQVCFAWLIASLSFLVGSLFWGFYEFYRFFDIVWGASVLFCGDKSSTFWKGQMQKV